MCAVLVRSLPQRIQSPGFKQVARPPFGQRSSQSRCKRCKNVSRAVLVGSSCVQVLMIRNICESGDVATSRSDRFGASCGLSGRMWRGAAIGLRPWFVLFLLGLAWADHLQNNHTAEQSECEREASHGELLAWLGVEVPQCTADGSYNTTQCWSECFCADPQDGRLYYETATPRGEDMRHDCHVYWHTPHPATCHVHIEYNTEYSVSPEVSARPRVGSPDGRRPEGDPTRGRAGTEGDAEYTVLYFIYIIPTQENAPFNAR
ncbi:hypothetical protein Bbelb_224130 [Branchiostoma belcheri]|nr:hypothetical protein Bbelb_224130 [Branchiostoma belcheri]